MTAQPGNSAISLTNENRAIVFPQAATSTPLSNSGYESKNVFYDQGEEGQIDLFQLAKIIFKRKLLILSFLIFGGIAGVLFGLQQTPLYKATATIQVQKQEAKIVDGEGVSPQNIADAEFMQTQYALLKSYSLAERVVLSLGLERDSKFSEQEGNRDDRVQKASKSVLENQRINGVGRSRIIEVSFIDPDPNAASRITNSIANNFIETTLERKFNATAFARDFLTERLSQAKVNLEEAERSLVEYAEQKNILELGESGDQSSLLSSQLSRLSVEYSDVQSKRLKAERSFFDLKGGSATIETLDSVDLVRLRKVRSELNSEYQELLGTYKPQYPTMLKLTARIKAIELEIEQERGSLVESLDAEYRSLVAQEKEIQNKIENLKSELRSLRNRSVDYTILSREVDTAGSQYDALLQRLKEVTIASGVGSSQISIVDKALPPKTPFSPNIPLIIALASVLGLAVGVSLAVCLYLLDNTIKTPEDIKDKLKLAPLGVIPMIDKRGGDEDIIMTELDDPRSPVTEAYFSARTSLEYTTNTGIPKSLLVTSTQPSEGKSSTALSLAVSLAKIGRKVIIIDADLRKPSFVTGGESQGLSGMLTKSMSLKDNILFSEKYGLHLLPSGTIPPNPAQILSTPRLKLVIEEAEGMFDVVIVDSPPVLSFTDSPLLGAACEAAVIVFKSGNIRTPAAQKTIERLVYNNVNVVGAILTHFNAKTAGYNNDYYYYSYGKAADDYGKNTNIDAKKRKIRLFSKT